MSLAIALSRTAPRSLDSLRRYFLLIGMGYLVMDLADPGGGIGALPLQFLLKDRLHFSASAMAGFGAISMFAWYLKPLAGMLTDSIPLFGTRRRHYLLLSSALAGALWLLMGMVPHRYLPLLGTAVALNVALMIVQTTLGGLLVQAGKEHGATGRMSSQRAAAGNAAGLIAGPVGGFLAARAFGLTVGLSAFLLFSMTLVFFTFATEKRGARADFDAWGRVWGEIKTLLRSRPMWGAIGFWCLVRFAPGFGTPFFFYQTNTLKFSSAFLGTLALLSGGCGLVGADLYARACQRLTLRPLLAAGILLNVLVVLLYFGYRSHAAALIIEPAAGLAGTIAFLPILDFLARATPRGSEALGYALIFSLGNISGALSNIIGSRLYDQHHWSFMHLIGLNAGTTALVLLALPFLPRALIRQRDGETAAG